MPSGRTPAVVLQVTDYGESDKIVTLCCPALGKLVGIAKGAKRSKRRFVNKLEIFSLLEIEFAASPRNSLVRIEQAEIFHSFPQLRQNYEVYAAASLICELVLNWTRENDGDEELFSLLVWAFEQLNQGQALARVLIFFQIKMLTLLGYRPHLTGCRGCGNQEASGAPYQFSIGRSALFCARCQGREPLAGQTAALSLHTVRLLQKAQDLPRQKLGRLQFSATAVGESLGLLRRYGSYLLQREIHSWDAVSAVSAEAVGGRR